MSNQWKFGLALTLIGCLPLVGCGKANDSAAPQAASDTAPATGDSASAPGSGTERATLAVNATDAKHPLVVLKTSHGEIKLKLDAEHSPATVRNFLDYVNQGHYNGTVFHQVVSGYMILGGGFTPKGEEKPAGTPIRNEAHNGLKNRRGTIAMARSPEMIDSSTCQFFINLSDNEALNHKQDQAADYGYCVFGEVIEGLEIVDKISGVAVRDQQQFAPVDTVLIESARRLR